MVAGSLKFFSEPCETMPVVYFLNMKMVHTSGSQDVEIEEQRGEMKKKVSDRNKSSL